MLDFQRVKLSDKNLVKSHLDNIPPYLIEHTFGTLFGWQQPHNFHFAVWGGFLFLRTTYNDVTSFFPPIPDAAAAQGLAPGATPWEPPTATADFIEQYRMALEQIIEYCHANSLPCIITEVGEHDLPLIQQTMPDFFTAAEDRDNANYIYRVEDLTRLKGKTYRNKRNHLNAFKRNYPYYEFSILTRDLIPECRKTLKMWLEENKEGSQTTINQEHLAIDELFANFEELDLTGACITLGNQVEAFAIGERISNQTCAILIEKASVEYRGLYAAINQMFLESSWQDYTYVNRAEDMGLANLRQTKLDYAPCHLAMKYILTADI